MDMFLVATVNVLEKLEAFHGSAHKAFLCLAEAKDGKSDNQFGLLMMKCAACRAADPTIQW